MRVTVRPPARGARRWLAPLVLVLALLCVAFVPIPGAVTGQQAIACRVPACKQSVSAQRWAAPLPGDWAVGSGAAGTFPSSGQASVAVGNGLAVVGYGLTVRAYALRNGSARWQATLDAVKPGSAVISVRAWTGVVTVGVAAPSGASRTEVVIDATTGVVLRHYPATLFGGAVAATAATTTVIGTSSVTSYDNKTGKVRWRRPADSAQAWRTDGNTLYLTESAGGYLHGAPVTGLRVIDLTTGAERTLGSPASEPFPGSLAEAAAGVVLFTSAAGVAAYSSTTGGKLWSLPAVVPEGTDPAQDLVYLTSASGALLGVDPQTGQVRRSVSGATAPGSAGMYVVRGGVALGLDSGSSGEAWGYSLAAGRVTWTAPGLPWPHYFADVSGIGGSAAQSGDIVVIAACRRLSPRAPASPTPTGPSTTASPVTSAGTLAPASQAAPPPSPGRSAPAATSKHGPAAATSTSSSPSASPSPTASPSPSPSPPQMCAAPVLVALAI